MTLVIRMAWRRGKAIGFCLCKFNEHSGQEEPVGKAGTYREVYNDKIAVEAEMEQLAKETTEEIISRLSSSSAHE